MQLNEGISFGLFRGISVWLLFALWVWLIIFAVKTRELTARAGLILVIIGAGMNLYSRIVHGYVIDYWNFLGLFYNNLADYLIFFGAVVYGYTHFVRRR